MVSCFSHVSDRMRLGLTIHLSYAGPVSYRRQLTPPHSPRLMLCTFAITSTRFASALPHLNMLVAPTSEPWLPELVAQISDTPFVLFEVPDLLLHFLV